MPHETVQMGGYTEVLKKPNQTYDDGKTLYRATTWKTILKKRLFSRFQIHIYYIKKIK